MMLRMGNALWKTALVVAGIIGVSALVIALALLHNVVLVVGYALAGGYVLSLPFWCLFVWVRSKWERAPMRGMPEFDFR